MDLQQLIEQTAETLSQAQMTADGVDFYRGEFVMRIHGTLPRNDFNFLSGYALLHLACAMHVPGALRGPARTRVDGILALARDLPAHYQSAHGTHNWYHGKANGDRAPHAYPWPNGVVLSICDDLDDTAVAALLCSLRSDFTKRLPYRAEIFTARTFEPDRDALRPSSVARLREAGIAGGVYLTWCLDTDAIETEVRGGRVRVPAENSVELITVGNIVTAVCRLASDREPKVVQTVSKQFVNRYLRRLMAGLIDRRDVQAVERAARYYPRAPFAPVAFLLRDHVLSGGFLLDLESLDWIDRALAQVGPEPMGSSGPFAARAYWLDAMGWAAVIGLQSACAMRNTFRSALSDLIAEHYSANGGGWPDFAFFKDAHVGDYGGLAYSQALMIEALALAASFLHA